jgi:hypothetical protein
LIITFFFLFSVSLISYFSLGVSMSWGKKSLDVFLSFFCKNQQLPLFFPSSSSSSSPLSAAGLCCWADERAEAFEFGYLIVLAFGAHGACLTLLERETRQESVCYTSIRSGQHHGGNRRRPAATAAALHNLKCG